MFRKIKEALFNNIHTRQTVAKNVFWLSAGQIGSRLFRALVIIYAARVLGAAEYGVFSYVLGLAGFFTIFADIGINPILTKEAAKDPSRASEFFATSFWIKIVLLVFTAVLILSVAPHFSKIEAAKALLPFAALLVIFDGIREFSSAFFRAKERMELEALVTSATNVAITVFGFLILRASQTAGSIAITYALSAGTGTILGIFILRGQFAKIFRAFRKDLLAPIMNLAWPIAFLSLIGAFMLNVDVVMLGFFKGAEEVGFYSASQKIVQLLYTLPSILAASFYPVLAKFLGQKDSGKVRALMEKGMTASFLLALPIAVGGIILAKSIIVFLYGAAYLPSVNNLQVLLFTILVIFPSLQISNYLMVYDRQRKMVPIILAGSLSNIVFNAILIPPYGALGAAIATVLAQFIYVGLGWRLAKTANYFVTFPHLKKIAVASFIMGVVSLVANQLHIHLLINISVSAVVYFFMLYIMKEGSILEIRSLVTKRGSVDSPA